MPLDTHKQGYAPSPWACLPNWKGLIYFVPPPMRGTVQGAEPGIACNCTCYTYTCSPRLKSHYGKKKKSIFRALKAFLFFCGDEGGGGKGKMNGCYWHF